MTKIKGLTSMPLWRWKWTFCHFFHIENDIYSLSDEFTCEKFSSEYTRPVFGWRLPAFFSSLQYVGGSAWWSSVATVYAGLLPILGDSTELFTREFLGQTINVILNIKEVSEVYFHLHRGILVRLLILVKNQHLCLWGNMVNKLAY